MSSTKKGYGVQKEHDKWYFRDAATDREHGPFAKREEAREVARKLKAERVDENA